MKCNIATILIRFKLNIWDVGGQSTLRPFWRNYFEKTDLLIWVVDVASLERLPEVSKELRQTLDEDRLVGAGLLVWVNKMDTVAQDIQKELLDKITKVIIRSSK